MSEIHSLVVGVNDPFYRRKIEDAVHAHPGFRPLGAVGNAVQTVDVARQLVADVIVLADESPGLRGRDVLDEIARDLPASRVIITSTGDLVELRRHPVVSAAVADGDIDEIVLALDALHEWFANPNDFGVDRRMHTDRRVHQDWSKTFAERRVGPRREMVGAAI